MVVENHHFYTHLRPLQTSINEVMGRHDYFQEIPEDWEVVVTDIKHSTQAIRAGNHSLVNLIATGSIIAALNIAKKAQIQIPFFFGGDGATLIVPRLLRDSILVALEQHKKNSKENFDLALRVGSVPIRNIYKESHSLSISKVHVNPAFSIPIVLGNGLKVAEDFIKQSEQSTQVSNKKELVELDLQGMECRWNKIKPPKKRQEILSLLVEAKDPQTQGMVFKTVLDNIESSFGNLKRRKPISANRLNLDTGLGKIRAEMMVKLGKGNLMYLLRNWMQTQIGHLYFAFNQQGKNYLNQLVELTDTLVIDGRINTVISGTREQREELVEKLDDMERKGEILYGIYVSEESVMSCYVTDRKDQHIHFVDGSNGGYTQAATMLKQKIKQDT